MAAGLCTLSTGSTTLTGVDSAPTPPQVASALWEASIGGVYRVEQGGRVGRGFADDGMHTDSGAG